MPSARAKASGPPWRHSSRVTEGGSDHHVNDVARKAHLGEPVAAGRALLAEVEGIDDPAVAGPAALPDKAVKCPRPAAQDEKFRVSV